MKKSRGTYIGILFFLLIFCCMQNTRIYAADSETPEHSVHPNIKVKNQCMLTLTFQNDTANCILMISAKQSATSIHGTLALYDETDQIFLSGWPVSTNGTSYSGSMSVTIDMGHIYTLSFSGQVTDTTGKSEEISASVTKSPSALSPEVTGNPGVPSSETVENPVAPPSETVENPVAPPSETVENLVSSNTQIPESSTSQIDNTCNITNSSSNPKSASATKIEYAASKNSSFSGTYKTDARLYLRTGAGQNKTSLCIMEKGDLVYCYGFYTTLDKTDWLYVQYKQNGTLYTGFCSSKYLSKKR